ncbi:MAG: hypothetical protein JSU61_13815 [Fidelibacterota bacterium]|nr:MAG: hypothetical protein JSU61_13815 [Candidatus Neomarinimicrobiota bacterium]
MRRLIPLCFLFSSLIYGQAEIYEDLYRVAFEDGKISPEEQQLLTALQNKLGLEEEEIQEIQRKVLDSRGIAAGRSRAGRRRVIAQNMAYGNGLYGWAVPYVLGIESPTVYTGIQLLAIAGGFYLSWQYTQDMDIPLSRADFQIAGSTLGLWTCYPLVAVVGGKRWFDFDPDGKVILSYAMLSVPLGIRTGDRLYHRWQPSDGQARAVIWAGSMSGLNAVLAHLLFTTEDGPENPESWNRLNSLLVTGAIAGGSYLGWRQFSQDNLTIGDVRFITMGTMLGWITAMELGIILEPEYKPSLALLLASLDGFSYITYHLGRGYDFTSGDVAIIGLGSFAGFTAFRGISLILGMDQSNKLMNGLDIASYLGGAYLTFRYIQPRTEMGIETDLPIELSIGPTFLSNGKQPVPAMGLNLRF